MTKLNERQAQLRDQHLKDLEAAHDVVASEYERAKEAYDELERAVEEYDLEVEKVNRFLMDVDDADMLEELDLGGLPAPTGHEANVSILSGLEEGEDEEKD